MALSDIMSGGKHVYDSSSSSDSESSSSSSSSPSSSLLSSSSVSSATSSPSQVTKPPSRPSSPVNAKAALGRRTAAAKTAQKPNTNKGGRGAGRTTAALNASALELDPKDVARKPRAKRAPVAKRPGITATQRKKAKVDKVDSPPLPPPLSPSPPSSPPPPPPPSPPPVSDGESDDESSSSEEASSESSSSSDSEDMDGAMNAATTLIRLDERSKQDRESREALHPPTPDSLKVKLKLPPGFLAKQDERPGSASTTDRGKLKVQLSKSHPATTKHVDKMTTSTATRKRVSATVTSKKTAGSKRKKTDAPSSSSGQSGCGATHHFQQHQQQLPSHATIAGSTAHILSHLIPKGEAIPSGEVRGKMELSFVDKQLGETHPAEITESEISSDFDDPFATEAEALRNLDMFSFCDEYGNPIGLEVLEQPKEERPRIMGFGTVIQHLPASDRPLPVKCVLPSPAFPSRSRKRQRPNQASSVSAQEDGHKFARSINSPEVGQTGTSEHKPVKAYGKPTSNLNSDEQGAASFAADVHESAMRTEETDSDCDTEGAIASDHHEEVKSTRKSTEDQRFGRERSCDVKRHLTTANSEVDELMRIDRDVLVEPSGTFDQLNLLECGFRHPSDYKRVRVWLPEISDWCLDYSDGDPTLWVITAHAWYKIAGPLSGMLPHPSYRRVFSHVRKLFEASYLVAYVLREWLPVNKKVSYRSTLQQIVQLSLKGRYPLSAWFLMENYPFIRNQISDLVADKDLYLDSMFFKQLHRLYDAHTARENRLRKEIAEREERKAKREEERLEKKRKVEEERKRIQTKREEERRQKEAERRYPIEDLDLLADGTHDNVIPIQLKPWGVFEGKLLGDLIMVWQTINNFTPFNNLEPITLHALTSSVADHSVNGTSSALVGIFMAFLRAILSEKSFVSPMDDLIVEGSTTVADLFADTKRTYGICGRSYMEILSPVTWQEILRQLMAKGIGIDASIGNIEPLVGCEIVRQMLYMQNNSAPFNTPVDTTIKGLEDYNQIIKQPMDLGTIRRKIQDGSYEGTDGHNEFAADVRLVWDNCIVYNGEDSDIGRAALSLSDMFEQDFGRLVIERIGANKSRLEASRDVLMRLRDQSEDWSDRSLVDIVHGLYVRDFHELPVSFKLGALSWICTEFLKLESIRSHIESQAEAEIEVLRKYRRKLGEIDAKRKAAEKSRREQEALFRQSCIDQGIEPNSNNQFSDIIKQQHQFIATFYSENQAAKQTDDATWHDERQSAEADLQRSMDGLRVRLSPLGKDRFHNCYWLFLDDKRQRLFIEKSESGEMVEPSSVKEVETILSWLNPKGIRESDLLVKLAPIKEALAGSIVNDASNTGAIWRCPIELQVDLFPLPGFRCKDEHQHHFGDKPGVVIDEVTRQMLLTTTTELLSITSSSLPHPIVNLLNDTNSFDGMRTLVKRLETEVVASKIAGDVVRESWKRKRREWLLALDGSHTYSQLVFLLHLFLAECVNAEAFLDLSVRLDKKEWMKLRPKECRNFIPEVGKTIVYFGDGHAQALREDAKVKKKRFTRRSDPPLRSMTLLCTIVDISFYHGGGDPYALLVMKPIQDNADHSCARTPGSFICPPPTPAQQLARIFVRITAKLQAHPDSAPFLDPVSDRDFPEYKEIIPRPMDLSKVLVKARRCEYATAASFLDDVRLICSNCELFCEGRFPDLPPLARNLLELAEALVKKSQKEIRGIEEAKDCGDTKRIEKDSGPEVNHLDSNGMTTDSPNKLAPYTVDDAPQDAARHRDELRVVWRLEKRLPEYVVDIKRYEAAVTRTWKCGERFRTLFRDPKGFPSEYYNGSTAGCLPFTSNGLLPWEALRVVWDEDDGSNDSRLNPWEIEVIPEDRKRRG